MGIASFPFTTSIMGIVLITFLFLDVSKLHLLWIYFIVSLFFDFTIGRKAGIKYLKETNSSDPVVENKRNDS